MHWFFVCLHISHMRKWIDSLKLVIESVCALQMIIIHQLCLMFFTFNFELQFQSKLNYYYKTVFILYAWDGAQSSHLNCGSNKLFIKNETQLIINTFVFYLFWFESRSWTLYLNCLISILLSSYIQIIINI